VNSRHRHFPEDLDFVVDEPIVNWRVPYATIISDDSNPPKLLLLCSIEPTEHIILSRESVVVIVESSGCGALLYLTILRAKRMGEVN